MSVETSRKLGISRWIAVLLAAALSLVARARTCTVEPESLEWLATVEVLGSFSGGGTLVSVEGEPAILTNSHLLSGAKSARVRFASLDLEMSASRLFDSPLDDVELLRLDSLDSSDRNVREQIQMLASLSVSFCNPLRPECKPQGFIARREKGCFEGIVFSSGKVVGLSLPEGAKAKPVADEIVSGDYGQILELPLPARPGMSGSPYFNRGVLAGMLTKVELGTGSHAYAIPLAEIAEVITQKHFHVAREGAFPPRSRWLTPTGDLWVKDGRDRLHSSVINGLIVTAGGGATGEAGGGATGEAGGGATGEAGGGATGEAGGGATGEAGGVKSGLSSWLTGRIWKFGSDPSMPSSMVMSAPSNGIDWVEVANPFVVHPRELKYRRHRIAYFRVLDSGTSEKERLAFPSIARFIRLKRESRLQPVFASPRSQAELQQQRIEQLRKPGVLRMYVKQGQVMRLKEQRNVFTSDSKELPVSMSADLRTVELRGAGIEQTLESKSRGDDPYLFFGKQLGKQAENQGKSGEKPEQARAAAIFSEADLGRIERLIVEMPDRLYELVYCEIGTECVR